MTSLSVCSYERHGYVRPPRHHNNDPANSLLPAVVESGRGSPVLLGVLYLEVARRVGLRMHGAPLSEGGLGPTRPPRVSVCVWEAARQSCHLTTSAALSAAGPGLGAGPSSDYFVVWLDSESDSSPATSLVVDAYDRGQLWRRDEILELFDLQQLVPADGRQVLASMLASLRDAYWARAVGCRAEPSYLAPLSLRAAADGSRGVMRSLAMRRAAAAAERRLLVLTDVAEVRPTRSVP